MNGIIETPFKLTFNEILCSAAATICLQGLEQHEYPVRTIAEVCFAPQYGFTASASLIPSGPRFVRITDIKEGSVDWSSVPFCDCTDPESYELRPNDILIARAGSIGKSFIVDNIPKTAIFASYMIRLRTKSDSNPMYMYWCLQSQQFWQQIMNAQRGSAMKNINGQMISSLNFPLPPLQVQEAISLFLNGFRNYLKGLRLDIPLLPSFLQEQRSTIVRIEELATKIEEARGLRREATKEAEMLLASALKSLFDDNSQGWLYKKLTEDDLATVIAGQHILAEEYNTLGDGFPYITGPADFGSKVPEIRRWTLTPKSIAKPGDVLLTVKGAGVGKINFAPDVEIAIGRQIMAIRPNPDYLVQAFIYFFLQHKFEHFQSIATATTVPGFKKADVEELSIPFLTLSEQQDIINYLDNLQAKVDILERKQTETSAELDALLPSILDKAFKGEL